MIAEAGFDRSHHPADRCRKGRLFEGLDHTAAAEPAQVAAAPGAAGIVGMFTGQRGKVGALFQLALQFQRFLTRLPAGFCVAFRRPDQDVPRRMTVSSEGRTARILTRWASPPATTGPTTLPGCGSSKTTSPRAGSSSSRRKKASVKGRSDA